MVNGNYKRGFYDEAKLTDWLGKSEDIQISYSLTKR